MARVTAYISIGSNIGQRSDNCRSGITALTKIDGIDLIAQSRMFLTEPVNYEDQEWFVNAVAKIATTLTPKVLLAQLKNIERTAGRTAPKIRYGPRILDLDIIFYEDKIINSNTLKIPHPRMHKRLFVLRPFCDIDPHIMHPVFQKTIRQLSDALQAGDTGDKKVLVYE
jgi:2-amino-4-hydroxy-6-hydroxymethyldihydropteridine diphosphokinase